MCNPGLEQGKLAAHQCTINWATRCPKLEDATLLSYMFTNRKLQHKMEYLHKLQSCGKHENKLTTQRVKWRIYNICSYEIYPKYSIFIIYWTLCSANLGVKPKEGENDTFSLCWYYAKLPMQKIMKWIKVNISGGHISHSE